MSYLYRNYDATVYSDDDAYDTGSDIDTSGDESVSVDTRNIYDKDITANFRRIQNVKTLQRIINTIENTLRRPLHEHERESVRHMINEVINPAMSYRRDPTNDFYLGNLQKWDDKVIIQKIADRWVTRHKLLAQRQPGPVYEDMHEILKKEIGTTAETGTISYPTFVEPEPLIPPSPQPMLPAGVIVDQIFGAATKYQLQKLINPSALNGHNYIWLNSKYRNISASDGINRFQWNEDNQGNAGQGNFSYIGVIRDVVQFKIQRFRIPYPSDGSADNGFRQITLLFEEYLDQTYIDVGRRFHFLFRVTIDGNWVDLNPYFNNDGEHKFEKPLTTINKLTVSFGSPTSLINFDPDRLPCTFVYGVVTVVVFAQDHNLVTGDTISFINFTTADPAGDLSVINTMNQFDGHIITVLTDQTFSIPVDTTMITPLPGLSITCIFDSKTFQIPLEVTFIRPETINSG